MNIEYDVIPHNLAQNKQRSQTNVDDSIDLFFIVYPLIPFKPLFFICAVFWETELGLFITVFVSAY